MVSRFTEVVVDCHDPERMATFWTQVLGWEVTERNEDYVSIASPEGDAPGIDFAVVADTKNSKNRLHIDVNPRDREQEEEVERLEALGARRVDIGQGDVSWVVMADVEGNEFCVLRTRKP